MAEKNFKRVIQYVPFLCNMIFPCKVFGIKSRYLTFNFKGIPVLFMYIKGTIHRLSVNWTQRFIWINLHVLCFFYLTRLQWCSDVLELLRMLRLGWGLISRKLCFASCKSYSFILLQNMIHRDSTWFIRPYSWMPLI